MNPSSYTALPGGTCIWTPGESRSAECRTPGVVFLPLFVIPTLCVVVGVLAWQSLA